MDRMLAGGRIKRLHVDKRVMQSNLKHGRDDPPITVQTSAGSIKCRQVRVLGHSTFIYSPKKPLACGARLWIETMAALEIEE